MPRIRYDYDFQHFEARWGIAVSQKELKEIYPPEGTRMHSLIWQRTRTEDEELEVLEYIVNRLRRSRGGDTSS